MGTFHVMAMSAAIPEAAYDAAAGSVLLGLVAVVLAIGAIVMFSGGRPQTRGQERRPMPGGVPRLRFPAFRVAH